MTQKETQLAIQIIELHILGFFFLLFKTILNLDIFWLYFPSPKSFQISLLYLSNLKFFL